jgi:hypothetical protein
MNSKTIISLIVTVLFAGAYQAQAAQGTAQAKMKVISSVAVAQLSDLLFSEAAVGAPAETVNADTAETTQNASFAITGEANRAIIVTLPTDGTVKMMTAGGGSTDTEIAVDQFTSNSVSQIDGSGLTQLYVGATRSNLSPTQLSGDYEGSFSVDVVYQ